MMKPCRFMYGLVAALFSTIALQSSAALINVQSNVLEVWTRDWGLHVVLEPSAVNLMTGLQCANPTNLRAPLIGIADANYKTAKETLMLAYALKSKVKFYFDTTRPCFDSQYPYMYGVDALALP